MATEMLILKFDAPLMSFGASAVDEHGLTQDHPPLSLLTGMIGNALGYDHRDAEKLQSLQSRIRYAVRQDHPGQRMVDFHTVDLGQGFMAQPGWTTRGAPEGRKGGTAREGTHVRYREYLADAVYLVALTLNPPAGDPDVAAIECALRVPKRPLFIGRKAYLPATPILQGRTRAESLRQALREWPFSERHGSPIPSLDAIAAWWPFEEGGGGAVLAVTDERDWANQIHGGERLVRHGPLEVASEDHDGQS